MRTLALVQGNPLLAPILLCKTTGPCCEKTTTPSSEQFLLPPPRLGQRRLLPGSKQRGAGGELLWGPLYLSFRHTHTHTHTPPSHTSSFLKVREKESAGARRSCCSTQSRAGERKPLLPPLGCSVTPVELGWVLFRPAGLRAAPKHKGRSSALRALLPGGCRKVRSPVRRPVAGAFAKGCLQLQREAPALRT